MSAPEAYYAVLKQMMGPVITRRIDTMLSTWTPQEVFEQSNLAQFPEQVQAILLAALEHRAGVLKAERDAKAKRASARARKHVERLTGEDE